MLNDMKMYYGTTLIGMAMGIAIGSIIGDIAIGYTVSIVICVAGVGALSFAFRKLSPAPEPKTTFSEEEVEFAQNIYAKVMNGKDRQDWEDLTDLQRHHLVLWGIGLKAGIGDRELVID